MMNISFAGMISHITDGKNEELLIDWVPNFIAEMPLHLQLTKTILNKVYALNIGGFVSLPAAKRLSLKFRVPESVVLQAYGQLQDLGLITTLTGTRLRILSKPAGDLASKLKRINHYHLRVNQYSFLPLNQLL
jgi:DNA-binding transcriptional MocR family regulator